MNHKLDASAGEPALRQVLPEDRDVLEHPVDVGLDTWQDAGDGRQSPGVLLLPERDPDRIDRLLAHETSVRPSLWPNH
jgi:hypothetical protein